MNPAQWLLLAAIGFLLSCSDATLEQVMESHPNGNPKIVHILDASGKLLAIHTFHFNKIRESELPVEDGKIHGLARTWGSNGVLDETAEYEHGVRQGTTRRWYKERLLLSEVHFENGKMDGIFKQWHADGSLQKKGEYRMGTPIGVWEEWYATGVPALVDACHSDQAIGEKISYSEKGILLKSNQCAYGVFEGKYKEFYDAGQLRLEGSFQNGKSQGKWRLIRADGTPWKSWTMRQGLRHGPLIRYHSSGKSLDTTFFENGSGHIQIPCPIPAQDEPAYPDTSFICADSSWVNGKLHGTTVHFDTKARVWQMKRWDKGMILSEEHFWTDDKGLPSLHQQKGSYADGKRQGIWVSHYRNGIKRDSLNYQMGELWGDQFYFDSTGHLYLVKSHHGIKGQVIIKKLDPKPLKEAP